MNNEKTVRFAKGYYFGPGDYVAVCNNANFDGHYTRRFTIPADDSRWEKVEAGWYFLNVVNLVACMEAVYPAHLFEVTSSRTGR